MGHQSYFQTDTSSSNDNTDYYYRFIQNVGNKWVIIDKKEKEKEKEIFLFDPKGLYT